MEIQTWNELMPRSPKETKRYSVILSVSIAQKLEALAEEEGRSYSQMIARLVEKAIENIEKQE